MIDRQEILEFAGEVGLDPNVVEKDYVLGWMLAGIAPHPQTRDTWVFKGGTCLKKCYFETRASAGAVGESRRGDCHQISRCLRGRIP
ncbi:MAG: nucleotidyl transferase AbiEii/AbiGii toxin family protein [Betaproteobacteria bacterium]